MSLEYINILYIHEYKKNIYFLFFCLSLNLAKYLTTYIHCKH